MPGALEALDEVLAGFDGGKHTAAEAIERLPGRPDRTPQRPAPQGGHAFEPSAAREDARELRLLLPALDQADAKAAGRLNRRLKTLTHPTLLVVDEIAYLPVTQSGPVLFFQLVNRRYGHASTVLTSNKGFEEWGKDPRRQSHGRRAPWTGCSIAATSSTSGATATACAAMPSSRSVVER